MKETNVTIISTNLSKKIAKLYKDYYLVEDDFEYEDLLKHKKIIFFNVLNNLKEEEINKLYDFLKTNNILFINLTNDIELTLYTEYLIVYDDEKILIEGKTMDVLKNEKLLKRLGFDLPFMIDLSTLLSNYGIVSNIYLDKESLRSEIWK